MKFKKGDLIICINKNANPKSELVIGRKYKVELTYEEDREWIRIKGLLGRWSAYQFTLAEEYKPKVFVIVEFCTKYYK